MSLAKLALQPYLRARSIEYAQTLIRMPSVTPNDNGCQRWLAAHLSGLGFRCEHHKVNGVSNLIATLGEGGRSIAFAGHTDVVPAGDRSAWKHDPYAADIDDNLLFGRGAADMKTGLAAMLAATERHVLSGLPVRNKFMWLITSDEEGEAEFGSKWIAEHLLSQGVKVDMCLVGEPTSSQHTGDTIRVGRRGSLSCYLTLQGKQGHVAYPQFANNAIHIVNEVISALLTLHWDQGSDDFPGTSLQITHIDSGQFVDNLVPGKCAIHFNIRYSSQWTQEQLLRRFKETIASVTEDYTLTWDRPCEPYLTNAANRTCLIQSAEKAIMKNIGKYPALSTSGGTSDGRFFAKIAQQVIELGVSNRTIHQCDEHIDINDLVILEDIYSDLLVDILA